MTTSANPIESLNWLLNGLCTQVAEIRHAVVLSCDGLLLAGSDGLDRTSADQLAAVASGFGSLARGAGRQFGGGDVRQTIVEMDNGFMFVTTIADGSCLAVLAAAGSDVGLVAYEMALLAVRVSEFTTADSLAGLRGRLPGRP